MDDETQKDAPDAPEPKKKTTRRKADAKEKPAKKEVQPNFVVVCKGVHIIYFED